MHRNKMRSTLASSLVFALLVLPLSPGNFSFRMVSAAGEDLWQDYENYTVIAHDTLWSGTITAADIPKPVVVVDGATLTIEPGTHIEVGTLTVYDGKIIALGTEKEKIVFTRRPTDFSALPPEFDQYDKNCFVGVGGMVEFSDWAEANDTPSLFRYVEFDGMGTYVEYDTDNCLPMAMNDKSFRSIFIETAYATPQTTYNPALKFISGKLHIENTSFKNNAYADIETAMWFGDEQESYDYLRVVNSSFESNAQNNALISNFEYPSENHQDYSHRVLFQNNWYGSELGPREAPEYSLGGEKLIGTYFSDGVRTKSLIADPVIIVPGIMGSQKNDQNAWVMDPILHSYDDLIDSFVENGYEKEKNLFVFPYDWYQKNETTAENLKEKILDIRNQTRVSKVDVVAHSMGGLVARSYAQSDTYADDVDQLITIGTPQRGAPESYLKWEGGEGFFRLQGRLAKRHFTQEAEEAGYDNLFQYVRERVLSVEQLLPIDDYLFDVATQEMRAYPAQYPVNVFLENLNKAENIEKLSRIRERIKIVGDMEEDDTIGKLRVVNTIESLGSEKWKYGIPENFGNEDTDQGLELIRGDQTVTLASAKALPDAKEVILKGSHGDLPDIAQCEAFKALTGKEACDKVDYWHIPNVLMLNLFSPVDVQIVSPSGKRVGKNFATGEIFSEIEGAYYTGYDTPNEFITIPNPEKGEYRVLAQGTGTGEYRIEAVSIQEDADGQAEEKVVTFAGTAEMGGENENRVEIDETGGVVVADDQDKVAPITTAALSGTMGTNGWYVGDVAVTLTAEDNAGGSGVEKTEYSLDNGTTWNAYTNPLTIAKEGTNIIQYFSKDKQGNQEGAKTATIKIDKTAPEGKITFNPTTRKLDIIGTDNLSQNVSVVIIAKPEMNVSSQKVKKIKPWFSRWFQKNRKNLPDMLATLTDEAGHMTSIAFEKAKDRNGYLFMRMKSIAYDESEAMLSDAAAQYKWQIDRKHLYRLFAAHLGTASTDIESHYIPKKNETWIMERPRDLADDDNDDESERRPIRTKLPGMIIPYLETEKSSVNIGY